MHLIEFWSDWISLFVQIQAQSYWQGQAQLDQQIQVQWHQQKKAYFIQQKKAQFDQQDQVYWDEQIQACCQQQGWGQLQNQDWQSQHSPREVISQNQSLNFEQSSGLHFGRFMAGFAQNTTYLYQSQYFAQFVIYFALERAYPYRSLHYDFDHIESQQHWSPHFGQIRFYLSWSLQTEFGFVCNLISTRAQAFQHQGQHPKAVLQFIAYLPLSHGTS